MAEPAEVNSGYYVGQLANLVEGKQAPINRSMRGRYGREFKTAIEKDGTEQAVLERVVKRIAETWDDRQITVQQAIADVMRGQAAPVPRSQENRIRGFETLFELSPRQKAMERLIEAKGHTAVLEWVRERPEELEEYLEGKIDEEVG